VKRDAGCRMQKVSVKAEARHGCSGVAAGAFVLHALIVRHRAAQAYRKILIARIEILYSAGAGPFLSYAVRDSYGL